MYVVRICDLLFARCHTPYTKCIRLHGMMPRNQEGENDTIFYNRNRNSNHKSWMAFLTWLSANECWLVLIVMVVSLASTIWVSIWINENFSELFPFWCAMCGFRFPKHIIAYFMYTMGLPTWNIAILKWQINGFKFKIQNDGANGIQCTMNGLECRMLNSAMH